MEVPSSFTADAIRREKIKVLESVPAIDLEKDVVFGQYAAGEMDEEAVVGYEDEEGIEGDSDTETYVALRLFVENWRWQGVPFVLRTGKRLPTRLTQIAVRYRCAPVSIFKRYEDSCSVNPNILLITLQPNEGFDLHFEVKAPGEPFHLKTEQLRFRYKDAFGPIPDAYETLLFDVVTGDQTLFVHAQEAEKAWALYTPLLEADVPVRDYPAGSWGPAQADDLVPSWITGNNSRIEDRG
jgi:glucose-6-phosphate 1-dehydrogenase